MPHDLAVLLPGQGSQTPDDHLVARRSAPDLLARCADLLGCDPFSAPGGSTRFTQPAIFCTSVALWREAEVDVDDVVAFAGHSLGELTALALAGALDLDEALHLVVLRGALMAACPAGGMLALRADADAAAEVAAASGAVLANDNAPGQVVLAGSDAALARAADEARRQSVRSLRLPVGGAFHSPLMAGAAEPFARALAAVEVREPVAPVLCCATAEPFEDPRRQLADALTAVVRWREVVLRLRDRGVGRFTEVGPGRVLTRLVTQTLKEDARVGMA